jgi:ABC-type multidrug transport system ATPase subunit
VKTVLDGIDLTVRQGSTLALLGPNGADKTTAIAHAAAALQSPIPTEGVSTK